MTTPTKSPGSAEVEALLRQTKVLIKSGQEHNIDGVGLYRALCDALRSAHLAPQAEVWLHPDANGDLRETDAEGIKSGSPIYRIATPQPAERGPVAWMWVEDPWGANEHHVVFDDPKDSKWTPLYTRPQATAGRSNEAEEE